MFRANKMMLELSKLGLGFFFLFYLVIQVQATESQTCSDDTVGQGDSCQGDLLTTVFHDAPKDSPFSPTKMSFARRLNDGIYMAGHLTPRQIKYAADSGFKSVLSVFEQSRKTSPDGRVLEISTAEEQVLVEQVAGMKFFKLLGGDEGNEWFTITPVERMTEIYPQLQLPALLHCYRGVSITLITLLYYANQTVHDPSFQPRIDIRRFYEISRIHGLDFVETFNQTIPTVETVTGEKMPDDVKRPNVSLPTWVNYWQSHPVYYNWFVSGQINSNDLDMIKNSGFVTIVNIREGVTTNGRPTQGAVELINIASGTPTYASPTWPARQSVEGLRSSVLDRSRPNTYVSPTSFVNYESENHEEFGDSVGYNEDLERAAVLSAGLDYAHMPWGSMTEFAEFIKKYKDQLIEISKKGPVLVQCARGKRAATVAVLIAALQYDLSFEWSLQRLKEMGMGISAKNDAPIYEVYKEYLLPKQRVEL